MIDSTVSPRKKRSAWRRTFSDEVDVIKWCHETFSELDVREERAGHFQCLSELAFARHAPL